MMVSRRGVDTGAGAAGSLDGPGVLDSNGAGYPEVRAAARQALVKRTPARQRSPRTRRSVDAGITDRPPPDRESYFRGGSLGLISTRL